MKPTKDTKFGANQNQGGTTGTQKQPINTNKQGGQGQGGTGGINKQGGQTTGTDKTSSWSTTTTKKPDQQQGGGNL